MASEKVQAKLLLEWAEQNFMNQIINTPTRKENILDLVFSNSDNLINGYSTIVNTSFSDHNILQIVLNYENKSEEKKERKNPYPNTIYEYNLVNASEEDWNRYDVLLTKLSEDFDQKAEYETSEEKLNRFYKLVEKTVSTLFEKKEAFKNEEEKKEKRGNKIPKKTRILLRKKTSISKKIMSTSNDSKTLRLMKKLDLIKAELQASYKTMKLKKEKEAISKIKKNPKFFLQIRQQVLQDQK